MSGPWPGKPHLIRPRGDKVLKGTIHGNTGIILPGGDQPAPTPVSVLKKSFLHLCVQYNQMGEQLKVMGQVIDRVTTELEGPLGQMKPIGADDGKSSPDKSPDQRTSENPKDGKGPGMVEGAT